MKPYPDCFLNHKIMGLFPPHYLYSLKNFMALMLNNPLLKPFSMMIYNFAIKISVLMLRRHKSIIYIGLTGSCATDDIMPGISDIDFFIVFDSPRQDYENRRQRIAKTLKNLRWLLPMLGPISERKTGVFYADDLHNRTFSSFFESRRRYNFLKDLYKCEAFDEKILPQTDFLKYSGDMKPQDNDYRILELVEEIRALLKVVVKNIVKCQDTKRFWKKKIQWACRLAHNTESLKPKMKAELEKLLSLENIKELLSTDISKNTLYFEIMLTILQELFDKSTVEEIIEKAITFQELNCSIDIVSQGPRRNDQKGVPAQGNQEQVPDLKQVPIRKNQEQVPAQENPEQFPDTKQGPMGKNQFPDQEETLEYFQNIKLVFPSKSLTKDAKNPLNQLADKSFLAYSVKRLDYDAISKMSKLSWQKRHDKNMNKIAVLFRYLDFIFMFIDGDLKEVFISYTEPELFGFNPISGTLSYFPGYLRLKTAEIEYRMISSIELDHSKAVKYTIDDLRYATLTKSLIHSWFLILILIKWKKGEPAFFDDIFIFLEKTANNYQGEKQEFFRTFAHYIRIFREGKMLDEGHIFPQCFPVYITDRLKKSLVGTGLEKFERNRKLTISLCICTKNRAQYLKELLDSVAKQNRRPDEIVIIDNNSTDNTQEVIRHYKESLPIKGIADSSSTISALRNVAIRESTSEIIAFTDDDCILHKNWLYFVEQGFILDESIGAVGGVVCHHDEGNKSPINLFHRIYLGEKY